MKVLSTIIKPSSFREPFFDGYDIALANYEFSCIQCGNNNCLKFKTMLDGAWGWEEKFTKKETIQIKDKFDISPVNKSSDGGWPSISRVVCEGCNAEYLIYVGFYEYSNSVYRITLQGILEIKTKLNTSG